MQWENRDDAMLFLLFKIYVFIHTCILKFINSIFVGSAQELDSWTSNAIVQHFM